jgi:hypothetical protein
MVDINLVEWLFENSGPVIRHLVQAEFGYDGQTSNVELLNSPLVVKWLDRLQPEFGFNQLHGAKRNNLENVMGKLTQLGLRAGMLPFDLRVQPFLEWFREQTRYPVSAGFTWRPFLCMLVTPFLVRAGYLVEFLTKFALHRLESLYQFCHQGRYDIYVDRSNFKGIPKAFRDQPLVDLDLTRGGEYSFPTIYDMHLLARFPNSLVGHRGQEKIDTIVDYVLNPDYQALPQGYGIMQAAPRKYYAVGWSAHLPGYLAEPETPFWKRAYLHRLVLMSNFQAARQHRWYREGVAFFERFRTPDRRYSIPRQFLSEERSGCWVFGSYMGLEENRRKKITRELESTYWMLKIINRSEL